MFQEWNRAQSLLDEYGLWLKYRYSTERCCWIGGTTKRSQMASPACSATIHVKGMGEMENGEDGNTSWFDMFNIVRQGSCSSWMLTARWGWGCWIWEAMLNFHNFSGSALMRFALMRFEACWGILKNRLYSHRRHISSAADTYVHIHLEPRPTSIERK